MMPAEDLVGIPQGRDPVGDQDDGRVARILAQCPADAGIRLGIHRGQGIVKDHDRRAPHQHLGDRRALLLAAGKCHTALTDKGVVSVRKLFDRPVQTGDPRRTTDLLIHIFFCCRFFRR